MKFYVDACLPQKNSIKIEKNSAEFVGKYPAVKYINGCCGNRDYFRPTIASLMNDTRKAADYGPVNEEYIRKELLRLEQE